jgi:thioredoxin 1
MSTHRSRSLALVPLLLVLAPPLARGSGGEEPAAAEAHETPVLVGQVTREQIEAAVPDWVGRTVDAEIDEQAANDLAAVEPGAHLTIFLGTWCSDSRREVSRFWRALDQVGGLVPFEVEYVAVDRAKEEPADLVAGQDLRYVPTFVVLRGGDEVGRVVESAPDGIEADLLALLTGEASGVVTGRDDLGD